MSMSALKFSVALFVLVGLLFVPVQRAHACSCIRSTVSSACERSAAVFVGRAIAFRENPNARHEWQPDGILVTFFVSTNFKGAGDGLITITTDLDTASCGFDFEFGHEYLVFASEQDGPHVTGLCHGTLDVANAADELRELGKGAQIEHKTQFLLPVSISTGRNSLWKCRQNYVCHISMRVACEMMRVTPGVFCR